MLPITSALPGNFPSVNPLTGLDKEMNSGGSVSSTLTRLSNSALKRPLIASGDAVFGSTRSAKAAAPTLAEMPDLVLKTIIGYIRPEDMVPLATIFNTKQKAYFAKEINYGHIVSDTLSWVITIRDFDTALAKIQALRAKQRVLPLIRLGGHIYEMNPEDRPIAMALYAAEARLHYESTPSLASQLRAIEDKTSFCRLLIDQITAESSLRDVAARYAITSPSSLQELERLIVNTLAGEGGWAGKNARNVAVKFGIGEEGSIALLEQYIFTEAYRPLINETDTCGDIAERYGVFTSSGRIQLETYMVRHCIGIKAQRGENCVILAQQYEIITATGREYLEYYALGGVLGIEAGSGGNCLMLAEKYGICTPAMRNEIENFSIRTRLWEMAHIGNNCHELARLYGIVTPEGRTLLESYAINGVAKAEVQLGKHCDIVAKHYGIISHNARGVLENHAVEGLAGAYARQGNNCQLLATRHGISHPNARVALEKCSLQSLNTRKGNLRLTCHQIVAKYGIVTDEVRVALENHVVSTRGTRYIKCENDCHSIAVRLGLKTEAARLQLELSTIDFILDSKMEGGLNAVKIREKYRITQPKAVATLENKLIKGGDIQKDIQAGGHWRDIARKYGIQLMASLDVLQSDCVNAVAGNGVLAGENCQTLAERFGIISPIARVALEECYLDRAMADIRSGGNYRVIAARYGITSTPVLNKVIKQFVLSQYGNNRPVSGTQQNGVAV
ncbi:hypothetical protein ACL2XO_04455 [Sodalis sp. RH15]|uniref:hypothetical protein n=1 Tax=Sodalis sp. RH15 TaxID=3394330 RepID=UPI0039B66B77